MLRLRLFLFIAADLLFFLRVYALWDRSPKIMWLGAITMLSQVMNVTICIIYTLKCQKKRAACYKIASHLW
ncbi:hypothetical protein BOTBODRAFT_34415 [Botryobasidium botryosum FD-172 SS1]|uniref:Uncharacterized protein n=1 Tax=Botryobasidium botryosum (strain FD-172 SS1) TaxID=930990 RepID=A0A067MKP7_BOTB1|nr:hypothetical protein BOTBODRAFT_34415 [Botryobasidium botryosum FD-172 SS1]